uniref:Uncharacterized protein n=1 Tax=Picea sitchensis TaxID=3332 RepID=A0A6B9XZ70_PICSI|nr:hypothetical protein Q903MT_gene6783 [Picea sitchensis]
MVSLLVPHPLRSFSYDSFPVDDTQLYVPSKKLYVPTCSTSDQRPY